MRASVLFVAVAVGGLLLSRPVSAQTGDLEEGVRQVRAGDFASGVLTLDGVVARQSAETPAEEAARAHLYLGVALAGVGQTERAKAEFREAQKRVPELRPSGEEFLPAVLDLFDAATHEAAPPAPAPAEAQDAPAGPAPTAAQPTAKGKGHGRKLGLILGGGAAALGGGALALRSNDPPTVSASTSLTGIAITGVTIVTFSATGTDPDQDPLTYAWDFGDGLRATGASPTHVFEGEGRFEVKVTASDGHSHSATATVAVQARKIDGVFRPDTDKLRDYQFTQRGTAVTGLVDPANLQVPFEGTLANPRNIQIQYVFVDEGRTCYEAIRGSFDETVNRIVGTYTCDVCRSCKKDRSFPVVLTRR